MCVCVMREHLALPKVCKQKYHVCAGVDLGNVEWGWGVYRGVGRILEAESA